MQSEGTSSLLRKDICKLLLQEDGLFAVWTH